MGNIKIKGSLGERRLIARRIYEYDFAQSVIEEAKASGDYVVDVINGGDVCNSYGYPAETECALVVADPTGLATCWVGRAPANKVTDRGSAIACIAWAGDAFDLRCGEERKKETLRRLIEYHQRCWSPLIQLAACAEEKTE